MQDLWKDKWEWDAKLDNEKLQKWLEIMDSLKTIPQHIIPRYLGPTCQDQSPTAIDWTLLCFCDASARAYATVVYLLQASSHYRKVDLVFSKTRLAPQKITIPRLELLGVLIGIRALKFVERELCLPIANKILWTDSQCVLYWMRTTKPLPVFVSNRLKEIKSLPMVCFKYVPSEDNPADMATRGNTLTELSTSIWWKGPHWLLDHEKEWPNWRPPVSNVDFDTECKGNKIFFETKLITAEGFTIEKQVQLSIGNLINEERFSSLLKLLRITAWFIRAVSRFMRRNTEEGALKARELQKSKLLWDHYIQNKCFSDTIQDIKKGKRNNLKDQLNLQLDCDGIIRCHGRYENTNLNQEVKYPKLLVRGEHYTSLVIRDYHKRAFHAGVSQTLAQVRTEYWIPRGRSQVKRELNRCAICRRVEGHPFKMPKMPPWPKERVTEALPFQYTGLDYFGPLFIKYFHPASNGPCPTYKKVWVCLFTCMVVRAIHLELVEDMSTDQFLLCLRRFISRRGIPHQIISDNATQFKLAKKVLSKAHQQSVNECEEVNNYLSKQGIQWRLIVELAPWMGGFYERLVGLTKRALRKAVGKTCLTENQLITILTEIEAVVNSRPLVYVDDDINSIHVLTPSDFLSMNPNHVIPDSSHKDGDSQDIDYTEGKVSTTDKLLDIWKCGQRKLNEFWNLWKNDYLLSLRERTQASLKCSKKQSNHVPQIRDVVLIKEDLPRGRWKIGRIHELVKGKDQLIRSAKISIPPRGFLHRPLSLLYPIKCPEDKNVIQNNDERSHCPVKILPQNDCSYEDTKSDVTIEDNTTPKRDPRTDTIPRVNRPARQATLSARRKLKEWLNPSEQFISLGSVAICIASDD